LYPLKAPVVRQRKANGIRQGQMQRRGGIVRFIFPGKTVRTRTARQGDQYRGKHVGGKPETKAMSIISEHPVNPVVVGANAMHVKPFFLKPIKTHY